MFRFAFNHQGGGAARRFTPGALTRAVVHNIAMNMSDEYWHVVRDELRARVQRDIRQELGHVAQMYRKMVVGISGRNKGPHGTLSTLAKPMFSDYSLDITWAPRSQRYLKQKLKRPGHNKWFLHREGLLYKTMGKATTWLAAFGPIEVEITKKSMDEGSDAKSQFPTRFNTGLSGTSERVQIATVRVKAMRKITPGMLPALSTGNVGDIGGDGGDSGLTGLFPSPIAYRLTGDKRYVPYRHSIEPFLAFFLTRSIPTALARRMQSSLSADIKR